VFHLVRLQIKLDVPAAIFALSRGAVLGFFVRNHTFHKTTGVIAADDVAGELFRFQDALVKVQSGSRDVEFATQAAQLLDFFWMLQHVFFELRGGGEATTLASGTHALDEVGIWRHVKQLMRCHVQGAQSAILAHLRWLGHRAERLLAFSAARLQVLPHNAVGGKQLVALRAYENSCWNDSQPEIRNSRQFSRSIYSIWVKVKFGGRHRLVLSVSTMLLNNHNEDATIMLILKNCWWKY
jgi:hypothetical protein